MMKKIGQGRYQEVFLINGKVVKFAIDQKEYARTHDRMMKYYDLLRSSGVRVPKFYGEAVYGKKRVSIWEYTGEGLCDRLKIATEQEVVEMVQQVVEMGLNANRRNVAFYPIFEQFTVRGNKVYFVDFFPSRLDRDFAEYDDKKRVDLRKMFYGERQKIAVPVKEAIEIRPDVRGILERLFGIGDLTCKEEPEISFLRQ